MDRHEIPTHLDIEDKILFNLTVRQVVLIAIGASLGYSVWSALGHLPWRLPLPLTFTAGALMPCLALALALIQPAGRALEQWAIAAVRYAALPRLYVWRTNQTPEGGRDASHALSATP